jgi:hypothetical protein
MHHNNASASSPRLHGVENLSVREMGIGIARYDIPENKSQAQDLCQMNGGLIVLSVWRPEKGRVMTVSALKESDRLHDLVSLLFVVQLRQVRMHMAMRADFKKRDGQQRADFRVMFRHPAPGQKERGGNLLLNQRPNQRFVIPAPLSHGAHVERQRHRLARPRSSTNDFGTAELKGRYDAKRQYNCEH